MTEIGHRRVLARRLMLDGVEHRLVIVELSADRTSIDINPFEGETAATVYESRPMLAEKDPHGRWRLKIKE